MERRPGQNLRVESSETIKERRSATAGRGFMDGRQGMILEMFEPS